MKRNVNEYVSAVIMERSDYKEYRRKKKIRTIIGILLLIIFWLATLFPNNPNTTIRDLFILYAILSIFTVLLVICFQTAFFVSKPVVAVEGTLLNIQEQSEKRTDGTRKVRILHHVECDDGTRYHGQTIEAWCLSKKQPSYKIGDRVYVMSIGNEYLIMSK